jgi:hypothetical protein
MKLEVFDFLCKELRSCGLHDSQYIMVEEQLAMFLYTVTRNASNRDIQERFQHSGETVSCYFGIILHAINTILVPKYINLYDDEEIPTAISSNPTSMASSMTVLMHLMTHTSVPRFLSQYMMPFATKTVFQLKTFLEYVNLTIYASSTS